MIRNSLEFFNIREMTEVPYAKGFRLSRLPEKINEKLNWRARCNQGPDANSAEIRFVTDAPQFIIHLKASRSSTWPQTVNPVMRVMVGNLEHSRVELPFNQEIAVPFDRWDHSEIRNEVLRPDPDYGFSPEVWRFVLPPADIVFQGIDTYGYEIRPPKPSEVPKKRILCYGSSITASSTEGWAMLMGQELGVDVLNLGLSGACQAEPELADYLAEQNDYDYSVIELGINMVYPFTCEEFEKRASCLIGKILHAHPEKPMALITVFPHGGESALRKEPDPNDRTEKFREILRELYRKFKGKNFDLTLIEGPEIDPPSRCWGSDFTHPRSVGNPCVAARISAILRKAWFSERQGNF